MEYENLGGDSLSFLYLKMFTTECQGDHRVRLTFLGCWFPATRLSFRNWTGEKRETTSSVRKPAWPNNYVPLPGKTAAWRTAPWLLRAQTHNLENDSRATRKQLHSKGKEKMQDFNFIAHCGTGRAGNEIWNSERSFLVLQPGLGRLV